MSVLRRCFAACPLWLLASLSPARPDEPAAFPFVLAGVLGGDGELADAMLAAAEAVALEPGDPYVRLAHAELLSQVGQLDRAAAEVAVARSLAPAEPAVNRLEARLAMNRVERDPDARAVATAAFERWLAAEPDDLEALVGLAQLRLGNEQPGPAAELLERAARLRPGQPMIESLRARALEESGDARAAEAVRLGLLAQHPERLELRFEVTEAWIEQGRFGEVEKLLSEAPADQQRSPEMRRRRAVARMLAGDLDGARALADELLAELPDNATLRILSATVEEADGQWERVVARLAPVAARPQAPESVIGMQVGALEKLGRVDEALALLDARRIALTAARRHGEADSAGLLAADLAARSRRSEEAESRARELLTLAPGDAESQRLRDSNVAWLLSDIALERRDFRAAAAAAAGLSAPASRARSYEIAFRAGDAATAEGLRREIEGGSTDDLLALAEAELRLDRSAAAVPLLRSVVERNPDSVRGRFALATALERAARNPESEEEFERLLAKYPDHAPSLNYLGYLWIERARHLERAVEMVARAVRVDPSNGAYVDSLGWGLHQLGRSEEAVRMLERAARLEPDDPTILEHLGDAWVSAGDLDRARQAYERALAVAGDGQELSAKIARMGRPGGAS